MTRHLEQRTSAVIEALLRDVRAAGGVLVVADGQVRIERGGRVPGDVWARVHAHRNELIEMFAALPAARRS